MGILTTQQLIDETRFRLDSNQDISQTQLVNWLNFAYMHVSQPDKYEHRNLRTRVFMPLVLDQRNYDFGYGTGPSGTTGRTT